MMAPPRPALVPPVPKGHTHHFPSQLFRRMAQVLQLDKEEMVRLRRSGQPHRAWGPKPPRPTCCMRSSTVSKRAFWVASLSAGDSASNCSQILPITLCCAWYFSNCSALNDSR